MEVKNNITKKSQSYIKMFQTMFIKQNEDFLKGLLTARIRNKMRNF